VALAWLLRRAPNILLIPGTSSITHLRENLAAAELELPPDAFVALDAVAQLRETGPRSSGGVLRIA
jgi:aryl-alcohol dehydrogenase-like predicted oxidoreductase